MGSRSRGRPLSSLSARVRPFTGRSNRTGRDGGKRFAIPPYCDCRFLIRQMRQIRIDGLQLLIVHPSDRAPWHLVAERMAVGVHAGAHGLDEFRAFPAFDQVEVGPDRAELPRYAAL